MHWLWVHLGIAGSGPWYGFWSGFGSDLGEATLASGLLAVYRRNNCHGRWCWRIAHHELHDDQAGVTYRVCHRHHPTAVDGGIRPAHLARLHRAHRRTRESC